ncbi:MAG: protein translocase subunit SecD [Actinomycetota bacterium]|nr:protein translocase subunit SecD [Actinomycetota bacterium]
MAPPAGTLRVGRYFLALLAMVAVLYTIVFWPGQRNTPKLGIDLVGGTQVVFTARTDNGSTPSRSSMDQARQILADRVNGTGVTQATVVIQGDNQLVVSIPGQDATDISKLGAAAILNFRGLVAPAVQVTCTPASAPSAGPSNTNSPAAQPSSSGASGAAFRDKLLTKAPKASSSGKPSGKASSRPSSNASSKASGTSRTTPSATPSATSAPPAAPACSANSVARIAKAAKFSVPLSEADYSKLSPTNQKLLAAALAGFDCASGQSEKDDPNSYFVACDNSGLAYLLGTVIVAGKQIADASAVAPNISSGATEWTVSLNLKGSGQSAWADYTSKHNVNQVAPTTSQSGCGPSTTPCADYVAFTLDGIVISSPYNNQTINGGTTQITGSFTSSSANDLANKLKYGALPLSFKTETAQTISATLGTEQLKAGLLAGGIGLVLVVIYSLIYYRALGLVTIASLLVSGALTYGSLVMLATQIGFTLSLAGIAGFIVAVGITADSFVVFFERIKDEVHDGRSVRVAVPRAWVRARRTILSADTVSFLAAAILYYFTTDEVRGFAFTLGLSTILDLVVVFLFTHPLVSWLSRLRTFGSARFTGLDAVRGGRAINDEQSERVPARGRPRRAGRGSGRVAVLDETEADVMDRQDDVDETTPAVPNVEQHAAPIDETPLADETSIEATDPDEPPTPRRRTAPEPGSAAERAAARRALLREQRDGQGQN